MFLAISALVTIWMDPTELVYSEWAYWVLGLYIVHGVVVMLLLRFRKESTPSFRFLVHASDLVWPLHSHSFRDATGSPFLLFFVFVLGASAYRWGFWETFGTAIAIDVLLWAESFAIRHGASDWIDQIVVHLVAFTRWKRAEF